MAQKKQATNWWQAIRIANEHGPGITIDIPKHAERMLPPGRQFIESNPPFSLKLGAEQVYREDKRGPHYQIRDYKDRWSLQYDRFNPHYRPLRHAAVDATAYSFGVAVFAAAIAGSR
jgi:hypothetical protein